jgi:hypothetical protein
VSVDVNLLQKNFAKDLSNLWALVSWASEQQLTGSYSDRRPDLGRMFTCPFCHTRRHQGDPKCCNAAYAKTRRAWDEEQGFHLLECEERVNENFFPRHFLKRFMHKKHGQNKRFKMRALAVRFQENPKLLEAAVTEMQERWPLLKAPEPQGIPAFTERYWLWKQTLIVGRQKAQQRLSRKINRGV